MKGPGFQVLGHGCPCAVLCVELPLFRLTGRPSRIGADVPTAGRKDAALAGASLLTATVMFGAARSSRPLRRGRGAPDSGSLRTRLFAQDESGWDAAEVAEDESMAPLDRAPLLIDGKLALTKTTFKVTSPATGNLVGLAPNVSKVQIDIAVRAAHRAAEAWGAMPHSKRRDILVACAGLLREKLEPLATLQTNESGRPIAETRIELMVAAASFENAGRLLNIEREDCIAEDEDKRVVVRGEPVGVVAVIAPWNAPIVLGWKPTAIALACGNTVVLKPAPQTPLTTLRIGELLRPLFPPGVLNVVVGTDDTSPRPGEVLTGHPLVRKVVFTGSTANGSKVMEACSKDFKRMLLELGGNDAAIIRHDCDIQSTADALFKGTFFNNGQTCCAAKRIYVHESIFDSFAEAFASRCRRAVLGNGLTAGVELGPLANNVQLKHVTELVEDARKNGARILCGGGAIAGPPGDESSNTGLFYLPTIVVGIIEGTRLVDEEQFGPVVPLMPFKDDAEAIRRANATTFGLGASIWSSDIETANMLARQLKAGTVWVNRHCEFIRNAPFGGVKSSGIGRSGDLGKNDMAEYTEVKTLVLAKARKVVVAPLPAVPVARVLIEDKAQAILRQLLLKIRVQLRKDADAFEAATREAVRTFPFQPMNFRAAIESLAKPDGPPCVLVSGLPVKPPSGQDGAAYSVSEALLIGTLGLLGARAFAYESGPSRPGEEALVRELDPIEAVGMHRPGRCWPPFEAPRRYFRPEEQVAEFVASICARSDSEKSVSVTIVDFTRLCDAASVEDLDCLRQSPLAFFDKESGRRSERVTVVCDSQVVGMPPIVDLRSLDRFEPEGDAAAVAAYNRVCEVAGGICESLELNSGDMVIFNNKRCLHSWSDGVRTACLYTAYASRAAVSWPNRLTQ